jgi:hypothetical protein
LNIGSSDKTYETDNGFIPLQWIKFFIAVNGLELAKQSNFKYNIQVYVLQVFPRLNLRRWCRQDRFSFFYPKDYRNIFGYLYASSFGMTSYIG